MAATTVPVSYKTKRTRLLLLHIQYTQQPCSRTCMLRTKLLRGMRPLKSFSVSFSFPAALLNRPPILPRTPRNLPSKRIIVCHTPCIPTCYSGTQIHTTTTTTTMTMRRRRRRRGSVSPLLGPLQPHHISHISFTFSVEAALCNYTCCC